MTTTYDPKHPQYLDESDVRGELTRVFDVCRSCRRCVELCTSFPTLFEMIDRSDDHDAGTLTPAEQDQVVGECFQCKLCAIGCPYGVELHEWALDVPRLMLRAQAMRHQHRHVPVRTKLTNQVLGRTDLLGAVASAAAPIANTVLGARGGSFARTLASKLTGVSSVRLLPPYARQRFSTWFAKRPGVASDTGRSRGSVTVFPTCVVEYQEPQIGHDLVKVYERNGIGCEISSARCCGAPWLHAGDVGRFTTIAAQNVATLADEVRRGTDIVVPQPTCSYVLKKDYVDYVGGADARLVAEHTYDAVEYLMKVHHGAVGDGDAGLDLDFTGEVHARITYHAPCHLRAQNTEADSRDLMALTGAEVTLVRRCSGIDGMWGLRAENEDISIPMARELGDEITAAGGDVVSGDCHLANTAITEQTGRTPLHPLQVMARAYGIDPG